MLIDQHLIGVCENHTAYRGLACAARDIRESQSLPCVDCLEGSARSPYPVYLLVD